MKITVPAQIIPEQNVSFTLPAHTIPAYEIDIPDPVVVPPVVVPPVVVPPPPVVIPPVSGVTWFYRNGVSSFAGDFTQQGTSVDWANGVFSSSGPWGLFLPYFAANFFLPNPGFKSLLISLKPSKARARWTLEFTRVGDISTGIIVDLASYGPVPVQDVWADYVIPLADLGVDKDLALYKFGLQDATGYTPNHWGFNNIGFTS